MNKQKKRNNLPTLSNRVEVGILFFSISMVILIYWRWFLPGIITWGDWWYVSKSALEDFFPSGWINDLGLGKYEIVAIPLFPLLALQRLFCEMLHLDYGIIERILWFYPFIFLSFLSPWYLARTLGFRRLGISAAILVFGLNSYPFLLASVMTIGMATVLVPLVFALFIRIIQRPTFPRGLLFTFALTLQMIYELRVAYVTFIFCALYLLYWLIFEKRYSLGQLGKPLFLTAIGAFLLNAFWLIPVLLKNLGTTGNPLLPAAYVEAGSLRCLSHMTLLHSLGVHVPWWGEPNIANPVHPHFLVLPLIAFSILLLRPKDRKVPFFALSALIFAFLVKGSNPPFGGLNIWFFLHLPGFFMFRTPGQWNPPLIISYAILVAYLVEKLLNHKPLTWYIGRLSQRLPFPTRLIRIGITIGAIGVFFLIFPVQPISTHRFIAHPRHLPWSKGVHYEKIYIPCQVPQEYFSLEDFLHKQPDFFRTLWVPMLRRFGYHSSQHPGLHGINLSESLSPFCSGNPQEWAYRFSYISHPSILLPLRLFSIKYVIVPDAPPQGDLGDYYWFENPPEYYRQLLERTSRFHPVSFRGKTRLYEIPDPLPHLYTSTIPTFIVGNLEALIPLAYTRYLDDQPIFFFDEQQEGKSLERLLPQVSTIIFYNSNPSDLALQILKPNYGVRIEDKENPVICKAEKEGIYQIYIKDDEKLDIKIDKKPLIPEPESLPLEKIAKWRKIGEIKLEKGEHGITAERQVQELIIVPGEKIIQTKEKVLNYLKKTKVPPAYFFSKELSGEIDSWEKRSLKGSFYIPASGNYFLRAKINPQYVTAPDYGLKERIGNNVRKWSFVPKNVKYFTSTRKHILTVNAYFDGDAKEREFLGLKREIKPVDLEKYPNFEINYCLANPDIQEIEVILGIDLNNDGKIDIRVSEELPPGSEKEFTSYSFNLYEKVKNSLGQDLPANASFHLVKAYLKVSKKDGLDYSTSPNKGWYKASFRDFGLYGLSEDKCVKSRDYAFNERIGLTKKFPSEAPVRRQSGGEQPLAEAEKRGESKVIISRFFGGLDLEKYPYIDFIHQNEDPESLSVSIILNLDFNQDGKSDGKVTYEGVTVEHPFFDAYQLARTNFPDKNFYHLIKLEIRTSRASIFSSGTVSEESPLSLSLQHLQIYNEEIIPYEEAHLMSPTLKIDRRKLSLTKSESWYTAQTTYLKEGYHILDALFPGIGTKLDFIAIEPTSNIFTPPIQMGGARPPASSSEPQVEFRKINPARYTVRVKEAREPFWLVFSESFHEGWKAYVRSARQPVSPSARQFEWSALVSAWKDRGKRIELKEHSMANGYANGWFVPTGQFTVDSLQFTEKEQNEEFEIVVEFMPQRLFEVGVLISGLTLLGCVGYLVGTGVKRKKNQCKM